MNSIWNAENLIDTHCHVLKGQGFEDINAEFEKIKASKVKKVILIGCSIEEAKETVKIARKYPGFVYPSIGLHPEEVFDKDFSLEKQMTELEGIIKDNLDILVAFGEFGFEYFYLDKVLEQNADKTREYYIEMQKELFEKQVQLSFKYNLPLIIHCRNGFESLFEILDKYDLPVKQWKDLPIESAGIMHSFTDNYENAKKSVKRNFKIGVNGIATFKKSFELRDVLKKIVKEFGKEMLVLETDSPYLSPEPLRGKTNSPVNIEIIDEFVRKEIL